MNTPAAGTREKNLLLGVAFCATDVLLMTGAAWFSDSLAILSDLLKESTDFLAVLASYLTVLALRKAPGQRFAYGIGKLENLVSLAISLIMVGCSFSCSPRWSATSIIPSPPAGPCRAS